MHDHDDSMFCCPDPNSHIVRTIVSIRVDIISFLISEYLIGRDCGRCYCMSCVASELLSAKYQERSLEHI